jgi:exodeoxyribonuclease VII small subunit
MTTGQQPRTFNEVRTRLEQIVEEVRDKDLPLEKSLDLYEEAIRLGNRCSDLIDKADYSPEEASQLAEVRNAIDTIADGFDPDEDEGMTDEEVIASDEGAQVNSPDDTLRKDGV